MRVNRLVASLQRSDIGAAIGFRRRVREAAVFPVLLLLANGCGSDATGPDTKRAGVTLRYSGGVTDTIEAQIVQTIIAEVRGSDGKPIPGLVVSAGGLPAGVYPGRSDEAAAYVCLPTLFLCPRTIAPVSVVSDDKGRAAIRVRLGNIVGTIIIVAVAAGLPNTDTVTFTVTPGAPARVKAFASDVLVDLGGSTTVTGEVADRFKNPRPERPFFSVGTGSAVSIDSVTGVVRGLDMGTQRIYARGGAASDSANVGVQPLGRIVGATSDRDAGIHLLNFDGTGDRTVFAPGPATVSYLRAASSLQNRILVRIVTDTSQGPATLGIRVIDSLGATIRTIRKPTDFQTILTARIMADGSALIVARPIDPFPSLNYMAIYRATIDGDVTKLTDLPTLVPQFWGADISPDGTRLAFISYTAAQTNELRLLTIATGNSIVLAPEAREPKFSPNGDRVAYLVANTTVVGPPAVGLAVVGTDGTGTRVLNAADYFGGVSWSPNGTMLLARINSSRLLRVVRVTDGAFVTLQFRGALAPGPNLYGVEWW